MPPSPCVHSGRYPKWQLVEQDFSYAPGGPSGPGVTYAWRLARKCSECGAHQRAVVTKEILDTYPPSTYALADLDWQTYTPEPRKKRK